MNENRVFSRFRAIITIAIFVCSVMVGASYASAQADKEAANEAAVYRGTSTAVKFDVSPPLRTIPPANITTNSEIEIPERNSGNEGVLGPQDHDPLVQTQVGSAQIPTPIISFDGPSNLANVSPPDPVGDVGPNHYVAMSNLFFAVYDKTGNLLLGPLPNNSLWAGFGGDCETDNSGDPVVLYDQLADRWMLTQFTSSGPTYFNCVAISTSGDPTGTYYRYAFSTGTNFPDYPKYGVWSDAYYISTREFAGSAFAGIGAYALNRAQMIAGNPNPQVISFLITSTGAGGLYNIGDGLLPSDLDGTTLPPAGTPNFFMGSMDNGGPYGAPQDALTLWKFAADFTTPSNSSMTLAATIPVAPFDSIYPCSPGSRDCIPQPGTSTKIDVLSYRQRPMWRLAYRNFGSHESLVTNQSVEAAPSIAGIRWYEIRDPNGTPTVYQQGTYAPGVSDGIHRWMGSIAMDSSGNIALGYSASNASTFPSVWYTGRLATDPLGTLPQGEGSIINGTGSQTGSQRWGDYTSMNVDPVDDCTFWYVNEYVPVTSSVGWRLRIGAFKFDACGSPDFTLKAAPNSQAICAGTDALYDITVGSVQGFNDPVTLSAMGQPAGTTAGFSVNPVIPPGSSQLTIGNTAGAAPGSYTIDIDGTASTGTKTASVGLDLFTTAPGAATLLTPADGATNVSVQPTFTWAPHPQANTYELAIATAPNQASIVHYVSGLTQPSYTLPASAQLDPSTTYYWTVRSTNPCGRRLSAVHSFTTVAAVCTAPNLAIPDGNTTGVVSTLTVPTGGSLTDLDVYIRATHTWVGDLAFELTHVDTGTSAVIFNRPGVPGSTFGCSGDNVDVTINDEGTDGAVETTCNNLPAISGSLVGGDPPNNTLLSAFDGESLAGTWTLRAVDSVTPDPGTLNVWCLVGATSP